MNEELTKAFREIDKLARNENYSEALRRVDELAQSHSDEPWVWRERAYINTRNGETLSAISDITRAISMCQFEPDFFYTRGRLFFEVGQHREAVSDFSKVIECDLHGSDYYREGAYFFRADAYVRLGEFAKAKSDCRHVKDDMRTWTDKLRTKSDILADCPD